MLGFKHLTLGLGLLAALSVLSPQKACAAPKGLGLGLIAGAPSGLSGKYWLDDTHALDFAIGSFGYYYGNPYYGGVNVHADYLWHRFGVFHDRESDASHRLPLYFGVGGVFSSPGVAGVRGVLGISYLFEEPFDLFFEIAPTLVVAPFLGSGTNAGLGGRYYF